MFIHIDAGTWLCLLKVHKLCLKYLSGCDRSLFHYEKVIRFYFQYMMLTRIIIPEISLNTQVFIFHKVAYSMYGTPEKMVTIVQNTNIPEKMFYTDGSEKCRQRKRLNLVLSIQTL